jgi:magnesium chelatase family protein
MARQAVTVGASVLVGVEACPVWLDVVPVEGSRELSFEGWTEAGAREVKARVLSALSALGIAPEGILVRVGGAPAEWLGSGLDLAVAVGIVAALGMPSGLLGLGCMLPRHRLEGVALLAELALDGRLRPVRGAYVLARARQEGGARVVIGAEANRDELGAVGGLRVGLCSTLAEVVSLLRGDVKFATALPPAEARGNAQLEQAFCAAAAVVESGARVIALEGAPTVASTLVARWLWQSAPLMGFREREEVLSVLSSAGLYREGQSLGRSFRAPHHTVSEAGLIGGGDRVRPGEVSLAHRGVLFLDQAGEFSTRCLDALGDVLARGESVVQRRERTFRLPASPWLVVLGLSPCPCGWAGSRSCRCTAEQKAKHRGRSYGKLGSLVQSVVRLGSEARL